MKGLGTSAPGKDGKTPLHAAAISGVASIAEMRSL
jgi:hypothetical protein